MAEDLQVAASTSICDYTEKIDELNKLTAGCCLFSCVYIADSTLWTEDEKFEAISKATDSGDLYAGIIEAILTLATVHTKATKVDNTKYDLPDFPALQQIYGLKDFIDELRALFPSEAVLVEPVLEDMQTLIRIMTKGKLILISGIRARRRQ